MKFTKLAIAIAVACGMTATANAQSEARQSRAAQPSAYSYGSYDYYAADDGASPGDKPAPAAEQPAAPAPAAAPAANCGCGNNGGTVDCGCNWNPCWCQKLTCCDCPAWQLFDPEKHCFLKCHDMSITGWIDAGYTGNANGNYDPFNGPVTFNDRANNGEMNQLYLKIAKAVKTDSCCWQCGGEVDFMYGTDSRFTKAIGLELNHDGSDRWNSERFYQISMPQIYAEFARCNWDIKVGRFYAPVGYEVVTAPDNFFYSHSYTFQYAEPFTNTGVLVTRKVNDQFTWLAGFQRGWDQWEDATGEEGSGFILGGLFQTHDGKKKLAITWENSLEIANAADLGTPNPLLGHRNLISTVYTHQLCDRLTYIGQFDYGWQEHGADAGADTAEWYGLISYLQYQVSCCWWAGIRAEFFKDDDGTRVSNTVSGNTAAGPFAGDFSELTLGLNYKPNSGKNLIVRPELRWDHYDGPTSGPLPFDRGTKDDQFLMAIDAIIKY